MFDHEKTSENKKSKELEKKEKFETSGLHYRKSVYQGKTIII